MKPYLEEERQTSWLFTTFLGISILLIIVVAVIAGYRLFIADNTSLPPDSLEPETGPTTDTNATFLPTATPTLQADSVDSPVDVAIAGPASGEGDLGGIAQFGALCFTGPVTPTLDGEAECGVRFPPVVEMHTLFDYANMTAADQWTRVWFYEGQEVMRVVEAWSGTEQGRFDYHLNTSAGQPLLVGNWQLVLSINDRVTVSGTFEITETIVAVTPTPTGRTLSATPTATPPTTNYRLAYTKWDGSKHAIWVANLDGSGQQFLLDYAAGPSWSPDGRSIAFYGEEGIDTQPNVETGTNGIWRMGPNGENPTQLLADGTARSVVWSPNQRLLAVDAARGGADRRIYFIDSGGVSRPFELLGEHPSWSPDGGMLVAKACRPECGLWIANWDNTNPRRLTDEGTDGLPAWSPLGDKIAFSRNVGRNVDIYLIDPDGANLTRLTTAPGNDSVPAWTPDGRQLVFRTTRNGRWQIYLMQADGSDQRLSIDGVGAGREWAFDRMSVN